MKQEFDKQRNFYSRLIEYISQGDVELEPEARQLVKKFDFPRGNLESALESGKNNAYRGLAAYARICLHIAGGDLELEESARRLVKEYGLHTTDLDLALHIGMT